jgi:hypothetical protein
MTHGVRHTNPGWSDDLRRMMNAVGRTECAVGFPKGKGLKSAHYPTGASILEVAVWNNFGAPRANIPARPFMNQATPKIVEAANALALQIAKANRSKPLNPAEYEKMYEALGQQSRGIIQHTITTGNFAPNAPSTILRKKSSRPLIDSGDMRAAVTYAVRERSA